MPRLADDDDDDDRGRQPAPVCWDDEEEDDAEEEEDVEEAGQTDSRARRMNILVLPAIGKRPCIGLICRCESV